MNLESLITKISFFVVFILLFIVLYFGGFALHRRFLTRGLNDRSLCLAL